MKRFDAVVAYVLDIDIALIRCRVPGRHRVSPSVDARSSMTARVPRQTRPSVPHKRDKLLGTGSIPCNSPSATESGSFPPGTDGSNPIPALAKSQGKRIRVCAPVTGAQTLIRLVTNRTRVDS